MSNPKAPETERIFAWWQVANPPRITPAVAHILIPAPNWSANIHARSRVRRAKGLGNNQDRRAFRGLLQTGISALRRMVATGSKERGVLLALLAIAFSASVTHEVSAQEALRLSLAAEQAAEARRKTAAALDSSDMKLGPTIWRFDTGLGLEASDNIRLVARSPEGDLIFRPEAAATMSLPV